MRKIFLGALALGAAISLNAAVLATVNGQDVTDEDVGLLLRAMPGAKYDALPADMKQQVLDQAIDRKLLMENAIKSGIQNDAEYKTALESIKKEMALEVWMKKEFDRIKIPEADVKKFYDSNSENFMQPERVRARHILVDTEADANSIIKDLGSLSGDKLTNKFSELAKKSSKDPAGQNGGELGWFSKNQMVKPFSDAAFALKKGEITKKPVQTQFGYHVILVEDKQAPKKTDFKDAKENIEGMLQAEEFKKHVNAEVKKIRDSAKISIKK